MLRLTYPDSKKVWFRDDTYRWLDAARFVIDGTPSDPVEVLEALLTHDQYVNHYDSADNVASTAEEAKALALRRDEAMKKWRREHGHKCPDPIIAAAAVQTGDVGTADIHGPYLLEHITVDSYEGIDGGRAECALLEWFRRDDGVLPAKGSYEGDLDAIRAVVRRSRVAFRLRELDEAAQHDDGPFVLMGHIELLVVDLESGQCWLIAGGTD